MNILRKSESASFLVAALLLMSSPLTCFAQKAVTKSNASYTASWVIIDSLINNGLTRSAIDSTERIFIEAKAASNGEQTIKALIYLMRLESFREEDALVKSLKRLNNEIAGSDFPVRPMLQSMLAECYWLYYQNNRWRFYDRTQTAEFKRDDISTWDLRTIMEKMTENFKESLKEAEKLKRIRLDSFGGAIIEHRTDNALRPTLYDFLAHRAIDYFSVDDNELTKPAFEFSINSADYFKPFDEFARVKITSRDTSSLKFQSLLLLQKLTAFHANDADPGALIDVELKRLEFVRQRSTLENRDSLYLGALRKLKQRFAGNPASAEVAFRIARLCHDWACTRVPFIDERYRLAGIEAVGICEKTISSFPESYGARQCMALLDQIRAKELDFSIEVVNLPDRPFKALLSFRNLKKVFWRQAPLSADAWRMLLNGSDRDSIVRKLVSIKPINEWSTDLPDPGDYQRHSVEIMQPGLSYGHYAVLCSSDPEFSCKGQAVAWAVTQITRIGYLSRTMKDGDQEFHLFDRENGAPLANVAITAWVQEYDHLTRHYRRVKYGTYTSDQEGHFVIPSKKGRSNDCSIACTLGNDRFDSGRRFYLYHYGEKRKQQMHLRTFFFTDRAIYRPGQSIYFKGIMLFTDREKSEVAAGEKTTVRFYNVNGQEVAQIDLTSNAYGSIHGSFIAPRNTLNGRMHIGNSSGSAYFSVEDYKRPKFSVKINPYEGAKRLGDTIRVEGAAVAYAGSAVENAKVKYRVVRTVRFPHYWWCWWRPPRWLGQTEICSGSTFTNDTGGFHIDFVSLADRSIPQSENPVFSYAVSVDVTDIAGETQSAVKHVNVGYAALTLRMDIPRHVGNSSPLSVTIATANADGAFVPASGVLTVYRLAAPSKLYRSRLWERPDTAIMNEEKYRKIFPNDLYGNEDDITAWKREKCVFKEEFDTRQQSTEIVLNNIVKWQPGAYVAEGKSKDEGGKEVVELSYFTVYSEKAKKLPWPQTDFFVPIKDSGEPGEKARFFAGSGYENVVLMYEIEHRREIVKKEWLSVNNEQKLIEIPIEEKHRGGFSLHIAFMHDNRIYRHTAAVSVPWTNKELAISFETFRDKLYPGEKEQWRIKIAGKKGDRVAAEMAAALYDASLDAFTPHGWEFSIYPSYSAECMWGFDDGFSVNGAQLYADNWNSFSSSPHRFYPTLNWFGYCFGENSYSRRKFAGIGYGSGYGGGIRTIKIDDMMQQPAAMPRPAPVSSRAKSIVDGVATEAGIIENISIDKGAGSNGIPLPSSPPSSGLSAIVARTNLNETAFFYPMLTTNEKGEVIVDFTMPEALTRWNMIGFAHTKDLRYGLISNSLVTRKELMVMPNPPRFFRENDRITFTAKVSNLSDSLLEGTAQLFLFDAATMKPLDADFKNTASQIAFTARKGGSAPLAWDLTVAEGIGAVTFRVVAKAKSFTDGEEQIIPVLSNRMLVTESMPLPIRKCETKRFTLKNLVSQNNGSTTLRNHRLTLEFTTNPAWCAIQALPYLMEYPYECVEQLFSRFYANSIASHIVNSSPHIRSVFEQWSRQSPDALLSNLEKNHELKSLVLEETPWLLEGKNESDRKKRVALLFDLNRMADEKERALIRLRKMQLGNGGWPWFEGSPDDRFITQYIAIGLGRLGYLGIIDIKSGGPVPEMVRFALRYLDDRIREDYERIVARNNLAADNLSETHIQYLYMRSFFGNNELSGDCREAFDYFIGQAKKYWQRKRRYMQGMIALALHRSGEKTIPAAIIRSLKENAIVSEEMGMYWKEMYEGCSWWWYEAPIESQALMIEALEEVAKDTSAAEECKVWLLKSKQTQNWRTTKATAEACYALLFRGAKWLEKPSTVSIRLGDVAADPMQRDDVKPEAATGYFKVAWSGGEISPEMGNVVVAKQEPGVAWGALYWQYFEQLDKITPHETPLRLQKKLFLQQQSPTGTTITPINEKIILKPGDRVTVRIELRVDRDMEYVHMKDMRASGFEPLNVLSGYRWRDGLGYYESTRDASTNFFFSSLSKGTYVFEYPLVVSHAGDFSNGITTIQCMYAPEFTSHSEGVRVKAAR